VRCWGGRGFSRLESRRKGDEGGGFNLEPDLDLDMEVDFEVGEEAAVSSFLGPRSMDSKVVWIAGLVSSVVVLSVVYVPSVLLMVLRAVT